MNASKTIYHHPRIYTACAHPDRIVTALVCGELGRIEFAGDFNAAVSYAGAGAHTVRLPGAAVLPAFHDAHVHLGMMATGRLAPNLYNASGLDDTVAKLTSFAHKNPGDNWVIGGFYNPDTQRGELLNRAVLDSIFGARPVLITSTDAHSGWANSAALHAAGITSDSPDAPGGQVLRDSSGEPTGQLVEHAMDLMISIAENALAPEQSRVLADEIQRELLEAGITQVTDFDNDRGLRGILTSLHAGCKWQVRVHKGLRAPELQAAIAAGYRTGDGGDFITTGPVKFFADGALGSRTAYLHEGYTDNPTNRGMLTMSAAELRAGVELANRHGLAAAVHAIGDAAVSCVLDCFEQYRELAAFHGLTNRIEHAQHMLPADVARFTGLGVCASMQPTHCTSDYPLSCNLLGGRDTLHYPWRSLTGGGALIAFGSDCPIEPAKPFYGVHAAVTRLRRDGSMAAAREPGERLTIAQALTAYTAGAARAAGLGARAGTLSPGKFADFIAVDTDPYTAEPADLWRINVLRTVVSGKIALGF